MGNLQKTSTLKLAKFMIERDPFTSRMTELRLTTITVVCVREHVIQKLEDNPVQQ